MITIGNHAIAARIDPVGAELVSLCDADGREWMTDADPAYWTGHAPILFPIVGRLANDRYRLDGDSYTLPQHGFARRRQFELTEQSEEAATFRLSDDAETWAAYPFAFMLHVEHRVADTTLSTTVTIENCGERDMPISVGFHPAFAWPLPGAEDRADHRIVFERKEAGALRSIAADGTIAAEPRPSPLENGDTLHLRDTLFENDALVWEPVESRSVRYGVPGGRQLRVDFPELDRLGVWTKPGARFVCIEPWDGIADPEGFAGTIWDKPGIRRIPPGARHSVAMSVTLEA